MRRVFDSSVRAVAGVAVILVLAGSAWAGPRDVREKGRERGRESAIVKMVKRIVHSLGDGLTIPKP